jgi:hypothetical protein
MMALENKTSQFSHSKNYANNSQRPGNKPWEKQQIIDEMIGILLSTLFFNSSRNS